MARGPVLEDFARALRLEAHNLVRWPTLLPQQLFNQLRQGRSPVFTEDHLEERPPFATRTWILDRAPPQETALRLTLSGHADKVSCCDVAPDSSFVLSGSEDTTLKVWDAETGKELYTLGGHTSAVNDCAIFPDGRTAVSAGEDGTLRLWDLQAGREQSRRRGDEFAVACCAVAPDGSFIVSGGNDRTLKIWDLRAMDAPRVLSGHRSVVSSCAIGPDGSLIVSVAHDRSVKFWDARSGEVRTEAQLPQPQVDACAVAHDGSLWAAGGWGGGEESLKIGNVAAAEDPIARDAGGAVHGCAFSCDGTYLVVAALDVEIWDPLKVERVATLRGHDQSVLGCATSPNGAFIVSASADATLKVWNVPRESSLWPAASRWMSDCVVAPDGSFVVATGTDGSVRVLEGTSGEERRTLGCFDRPVQAGTCAVSPDGTSVIAGTWGDDATGLTVWDAATGTVLLDLPHEYLRVAGFSPDGSRIISMNRVVKLWDARTGVPAGKGWKGPIADRFALSPDWSFVVSAGGSPTGVMVWDLETGKERALLEGHTDLVFACAVSPDGSWFASGAGDGTVRVWDPRAKRAVATLQGHASAIGELVVAADGSFLASGSTDGTVRIWDASTWQERGSLQGEGGISGLAISPDCSLVVSWSREGTLRVWDARTCAAVAMMPLRVRRVAVHPAVPSLVACDSAGHFHLLDLRGVEFGPLVVAPLDAGDGPTARCPGCQTVVPLDRAWLGDEMTCSSCGQRLRINPYVVKPFRRPWQKRWGKR